MVYNPKAGTVDATTQITAIVEFWQHRGWQMVVEPTHSAGHAISLAQEAAVRGHQLVLAGGGDGTIGEVANGLVGTDTILAPLPMGTANSFAKELQMPMPRFLERPRLSDAVRSLAQGRVQAVDVGFNQNAGKNGRYWLMWSGIGAASYIVHALEPRPAWSKRMGRVGYSIQGLATLPRFKSLRATVQVDDTVVEGEFVLAEITNCRLYAGLLPMNPDAKLDDGKYEVHLFKGRGMPRTLGYVATLLQNRELSKENVITLQGNRVRIETEEPIGCHADGDQAGFAPLVSQLHKRALRLLVPDSAPSDLFHAEGETFP